MPRRVSAAAGDAPVDAGIRQSHVSDSPASPLRMLFRILLSAGGLEGPSRIALLAAPGE